MSNTRRELPAVFPTLWILLAVGIATTTPGASLRAQERPTVSDQLEVRLVDVEVIVSDRDGEPVTGLERGDFELLIDGRPVEVDYFAAVEAGRWPEDGALSASRRSALDRRTLAIYVDASYLEPGALRGVTAPLATFLRQVLRPQDRVLLVTAGGRLEIRQGPTSVAELVTEKLPGLERSTSRGSRLVAEFHQLRREVQRAKLSSGAGGATSPQNADAAPRSLLAAIDALAQEVRADVGRSAAELELVTRLLAGLPGHKTILYVGGRPPTRLARTLYESWQAAFGRHSDHGVALQPESTSESTLFGTFSNTTAESDAEAPLRQTATTAAAAGVQLYAVDTNLGRQGSRLGTAGEPTLATRGRASGPGRDSDVASTAALATLTEPTGGRVLPGGGGLEAALQQLSRELASYYALGFVPPLGELSERPRIEVRLAEKRRGVRVRHRQLFRPRGHDQASAELATAALALGAVENPLAVELTAGAARANETGDGAGGVVVPLTVSVPLSHLALVAEGRAHGGRLSLFFTHGGLERGIAPVRKAVVPVSIPNGELLTSLGRRVEYRIDLDLPELSPIAVVVRDDLRPETSSAVIAVAGTETAAVVVPAAPRDGG